MAALIEMDMEDMRNWVQWVDGRLSAVVTILEAIDDTGEEGVLLRMVKTLVQDTLLDSDKAEAEEEGTVGEERRVRRPREEMEKKRKRAVKMLRDEQTVPDVARALGLPPPTIRRWAVAEGIEVKRARGGQKEDA